MRTGKFIPPYLIDTQFITIQCKLTQISPAKKLHLPPPLKTQSHQSTAVNICHLLKDTGQYLLRINMFYIKNKSA